MNIYLQLFIEFFKAGLFAVGGGMATIPFLYDISDNTGWFTHAQLTDMIAISESTPGPIGINMATYVGYTSAGISGSVIATLGLITPSIIVILIIAGFYNAFKNNKYVQAAFYGLRPASSALIASAGLGVAVQNADDGLKQVADLVCEYTNEEDAVASVIEKYGFMEK